LQSEQTIFPTSFLKAIEHLKPILNIQRSKEFLFKQNPSLLNRFVHALGSATKKMSIIGQVVE
jgi:hypothetical protein